MSKPVIPADLAVWIEARQRFCLSHAQVQMARELGLNPKKFGKLDNHKQEPWKAPLPEFIEHCYWKRFKKERPEVVRTIEEVAAVRRAKKAVQKERKEAQRIQPIPEPDAESSDVGP